jgi:hypothetical protein
MGSTETDSRPRISPQPKKAIQSLRLRLHSGLRQQGTGLWPGFMARLKPGPSDFCLSEVFARCERMTCVKMTAKNKQQRQEQIPCGNDRKKSKDNGGNNSEPASKEKPRCREEQRG